MMTLPEYGRATNASRAALRSARDTSATRPMSWASLSTSTDRGPDVNPTELSMLTGMQTQPLARVSIEDITDR